ncbi:MAG: hypothetical protein PHP44_05520 [Kiritimatiellae bacterium]|nr:hypothetical protein [Kiritimatiellia bacterium]MDD4735547.1 hypothetical protein [Kiritimatiellia bacterium]
MSTWQTVQSQLRRVRRGIWFDAAIFLANCWLVPRLTAVSEEDGETSLAYAAALMLSLLLYVLGAGLKRRPLQERLARSVRKPTATWAWIVLFTLMVMQFALGMMIFLISTGALALHFAAYPWMPSKDSIWLLGPTLITASAPVVMTIRALMPMPVAPGHAAPAASDLHRQERFADSALYFSAVVILSIWDGMIMQSLAGRGPYAWYMAALLILLITVPFAMFYAAPRLLFLAEDYRRPTTWLRIATVMLPLSVRLLT